MVTGIFAAEAAAQCEMGWSAMGSGPNNTVNTLVEYNGAVVAGGTFTTMGTTSANRVALWDGSEWHPLGAGLNNEVKKLVVYDGDLIAGGSFTAAGGKPANKVARWDGKEWQPLDAGLVASTIWTVEVLNGVLYAGGTISEVAGEPMNGIARWDETKQSWQSVGDGVTGLVTSITEYEGDLIAAGTLSAAGGQPTAKVARWDGKNWHPMASSMDSNVYFLGVFNGTLYMAGLFNQIDGETINLIAQWDGNQWQPVGTGINGARVRFLASFDGDVLAVGEFSEAGGVPVSNIARHDPTAPGGWSDFENGTNDDTFTLLEFETALYIGGTFSEAGGEPALRVARWADILPTILDYPQSIIVEEGEEVVFTVAAENHLALTYQWLRDGEALEDGGNISGATTPTLTITNVSAADFGAYQARLSSVCGSTLSPAAALAVGSPGGSACPGDLNDDEVVNVSDLLILLGNFGACP